MKEVRITVDLGIRRYGKYEVALQLDDSVTCGEILQTLFDSLSLHEQEGDKRERWQLVERWRGCERAIPPKAQLVPLYYSGADREEVKICLKRRPLPSRMKERSSHAKSVRQSVKYGTVSLLFSRRLNRRRLSHLHRLVQRELQRQKKKYRNVLYKRVATHEPLWTPGEMTQMDILQLELGGLRDQNLELSSQVADLNMTSTDLRSKLNVLRQKSVALSDQLSKLEEEVKTKKEQRERQGPKDMAQAQTELIKFRRELEVRNRLNATQNIKLKTQKELLSEKQQLLAEKKKELEQIKLRKQQAVSGDRHVKYKSPERHPSNTQGREFTIRHTPLSASGRREQAVSSASKKRHSSIFEVKTRQLVEEESQAFLKLHAQKLDFDEEDDENNNITTQQPPIDYQQVSSTPSRVDHLPTNNSSTHIKKRGKTRTRLTLKKQVQFTADSIILNAALEGELDMLKQCTRKLGSCLQSSDKGATCLHNAVCSGSLEVVRYLVEQGCNVNAQDIDGWTPLHCAVAYRNREIIEFLVFQGASLFMTTKDGDTPLEILAEDYKTQQKEDRSDSEKTGPLIACFHYLQDLQKGLGHTNNRVVYSVFSRQAKDSDELSFSEGEQLQVIDHGEEGDQWWLAENIHGRRGLVPTTFLGPYRPPNLGTLL